ncbi:uracil-DNA glycosylase [Blastochloris sulfoviridis]|uniref:Type-5 uracil-DNA glycosylase n=1 Tax=Blastochloris sulfoviridis TaxID=50712 RepID=A0A5M6HTK3_9HYPH|nr:uracil-DNA glycosylase [Blastochloris sulfoviridis]KAA5599196.1 uracil-DNA glycosylase [Blastochloris sulfoviridis]
MLATPEPERACALCPRLASFRTGNRAAWPDWYNAPVPSFGRADARLLVVGLAPGLKGANRTGRPFTGDYAGDLLYATLLEFGLAEGTYGARPDDGLALKETRITNAVRCVPPENKPTGGEIATCRPFLAALMDAMPQLQAVVALGRIAHDTTLTALGARPAWHPFGHGAAHAVGRVTIFDSYHCSRYNTNTGRLTPQMFRAVFSAVRAHLERAGAAVA